MATRTSKARPSHPHTMSADELDRLVYLIAQARPDWDDGQLRAVLWNLSAQYDAVDLATAALRAAQRSDARTPKVIAWRGTHWDHAATDAQPGVPATMRRCLTCNLREDQCQQRPRYGDDDHAFEPGSLVVIR